MVGLLQSNQQGAQEQPVQPQQQQAPQPGTGEQPPGGAQNAFDKLMINALKIIHNEQTTDTILQRIQANPDKTDALGEAGLDIIQRLEESALQNRFEIPLAAGLNGLNVIIGEVANIAQSAGVAEYNEEQKYQAFSWAISNYIDQAVKSGKMTKEELMQAGEQIQQTPEGGEIVRAVMGGQSWAEDYLQAHCLVERLEVLRLDQKTLKTKLKLKKLRL